MGRWISPYGLSMPTRHMEEFAKGALTFRRAFCASPTCSPSRAALLTGQSPHEAGMLGLAHRGFSLSFPQRHLAAFLRSQGYETALFGVEHEIPEGRVDDFYDTYFQAARKPDPIGLAEDRFDADILNAEAAAQYLRDRSGKTPFFLSVGIFAPHRVFEQADPAQYNPHHLQVPPPLPDTPAIRQDIANYMATVAIADRAVGLVLDALKSSSAAADTLVIFTTDHGPAFPLMKCNLTDAGLGVTLIMDYPGLTRRGEATDALVSHLDLYPTICDLVGLPVPDWIAGKSLRPILEESSQEVNERIFAEVTHHVTYEPMRCIRTARHKLIRLFDEELRKPLANVDNGLTKTELVQAGLCDTPRDRVQLYDLLLDPFERSNLAGRPEMAGLQAQLAGHLHDWMSETNDPLLSGNDVAPPTTSPSLSRS
ncbi:sulfatase [soil metagenome]